MAQHDRPPFSGRPSLTGHCGHGWTCRLPRPVAHDPTAVLAAVVNLHCNKQLDAYSITSSARSWIAVDRSTPIALAVLRLITSSNFTGC